MFLECCREASLMGDWQSSEPLFQRTDLNLNSGPANRLEIFCRNEVSWHRILCATGRIALATPFRCLF